MLENKQFHEDEIWKEIQGFEGLYAVSNRGRVKNLKSGRILKNRIDSFGYAMVYIHKGDGKPKNIKVHKLVAKTFIPNPDNLPQINHIDECKTNNNVENLEWLSASQNVRHSAHQYSCNINQLTLDGQFIRQWKSSMQIQRELGYKCTYIIAVCKGKYKQAYGYRWEYVDPEQQHKHNSPVAALTKDGEFVAKYKSAAEAARFLKISTTQIYFCLNGTYKSTHGLRFIYIDD